MNRNEKIRLLIKNYGMLYSKELGIKLKTKRKGELFKWFLASILFGHRISEKIAKNTYNTFKKYNLLNPEKIIKAGWSFLVNPIMRQGGDVRYDGNTSTQILKDCDMLIEEYNGNLNILHKQAINSKDVEVKLQEFYGVGNITTNIFLRELRGIWKKADPEPLPIVKKIAAKFNINLKRLKRDERFARLECALIRIRKLKKLRI